jgi:hypothetical protein
MTRRHNAAFLMLSRKGSFELSLSTTKSPVSPGHNTVERPIISSLLFPLPVEPYNADINLLEVWLQGDLAL